jgi:hypothetical protein
MGKPVLALVLLIALATPPGTKAFAAVTTWAGTLYGSYIAHVITSATTDGR